MGKVGKFLLGGVLVAASFIPGVGATLAAAFLSTGISFSSSAVFEALFSNSQGRQGAIELNNGDNQAPLPLAFGKTKLGLRLADIRAAGGANNKYLYIVGALCHGSSDGNGIAGIDDIYFDEELAITAAGVVQPRWAGKVAFAKYLGTDAQTADPTMTAAFASEWTSVMPGRGVAYLVLRLEFDLEVFPTGIPNVTTIVRGNKVLDPRVGGAFVYSTNPALAQYDYLTSTRYGLGTPTTEIDTTSFNAMANYYDEVINKDGANTGKRFEIDGWLDVGQTIADNIRTILTTCRGNLIFEGGKYRLFTRRVVTPTSFTLNESNLVGGARIRTLGVDECPNRIRYTFIDPGTLAKPTYATETRYWPRPGASNAYLTADNNYEVTADAGLPLTVSPYTAEQIALVTMKEQRSGIAVECTAMEVALHLQVGDLVPLTLTTPGFAAKLFWVMGMFLLPSTQVRLVLLAYDADAYTLDALTTFPPRSATTLPDPFTAPAAPNGLLLVAGDAQARPDIDGTWKAFLKATWTATTDPYVRTYECQYRKTGSAIWLPLPDANRTDLVAELGPLSEGVSYDFRVRAINNIGKPSAWIEGAITPELTNARRGGSFWVETFGIQTPGRRWEKLAGTGELRDVPDPDASVGNTVGRITGPAWYVHADRFPYDPNLLHCVVAIVRQLRDPTTGKKNFYLGVTGFAAAPGQPDVYEYVNREGDNSRTTQHYFLADGQELSVGRGFVVLRAFFKGYAGGKFALDASMLSASGLGSFDAQKCVDGNTDPANVAFSVDAAVAGAYLQFDLGVPKYVEDIWFHQAADGSTAEWEHQFADVAAGPWTPMPD